MLLVPINQAAPGMRLAVDIRHPERGTILLTTGYELDEAMIRKLRELQVMEFWTHYPGTQQIQQYVSPTILRYQGRVITVLADMFDKLHRDAHADIGYPVYKRTLRDLIESLVAEPTAASFVCEPTGAGSNELRHSTAVCFLSLLMGLKLQGYLVSQRKRLTPSHAKNVVSLGLGAMLHDIGKVGLAPKVRQRYEESRDDSDPAYQQHVAIGHKMITGAVPPAASGVVLLHHRYFDGTGFPESYETVANFGELTGEEIHVFARIVAVANTYDRLRYLGDGSMQPRVRVLRTMLTHPLVARFDPVVLHSLLQVVPAYPPGSVVKLNSGEHAIVMEWHHESPCQPSVQVVHGNDFRTRRSNVNAPLFDLRERPELLIIEHDGIDVSHDNFKLIDHGSLAA
jgi:hypothetical protein